MSDVWSAGVVLYMLLSGRPPFNGATDLDVIKNIKHHSFHMEYEQFDYVSDDCKDLLRKILVKDPNMRASSIDVLNHRCIKRSYKKSIGVNRKLFSTMINLQNFECKCKLEEAVIEFLITEFGS